MTEEITKHLEPALIIGIDIAVSTQEDQTVRIFIKELFNCESEQTYLFNKLVLLA